MDEKLKVPSTVDEGKNMIKSKLGHKKTLIILDDVDDVEQLDALAGDPKWFGKGSRVLITTRDRQLLKAHGVDEDDRLGVDLLSDDEAILLFNRHAFKKTSPLKEYNELSLGAEGLPLALKVLGSSLCDKSMAVWNSALERLEKIPQGKILEKLQISYDGLEQDEKEIFLDIACFFNGWEMDKLSRILDCCGYYYVVGIDVLTQKSLISLSNEEVQMHHVLQEMGRNSGRQTQSRLCCHEDIGDILTNNIMNTVRYVTPGWSDST